MSFFDAIDMQIREFEFEVGCPTAATLTILLLFSLAGKLGWLGEAFCHAWGMPLFFACIMLAVCLAACHFLKREIRRYVGEREEAARKMHILLSEDRPCSKKPVEDASCPLL